MKWGMPGMIRARYFFNLALIRQNFRQYGWIGIIYTLGLIFTVPLQMFMTGNPSLFNQKVTSLFQLGAGMQGLLIVCIPLSAGLMLFRYLQVKAPADLLHSLPLRREHLLTSHLGSGIVLVLVPVWLCAAITAITRPWTGDLYDFTGKDIWTWAITVSVLSIFLFCFSVFVGICTGQTVIQGIASFVLLILPYMLMQLISYYFSLYLYGYPYAIYTNSIRSDLWSPLVHLFSVSNQAFEFSELCIYVGLTVVVVVLSYLLYRRRHVEMAGQAIAFTYFNPFFKAGVMLCCMLIAGNYFSMNMSGKLVWTFGGYAIGAVVGYIASEMVIRKSWHIMSRKIPLDFAVYTLLLSLLLYIPVSGWTGYEARVPDEEQISQVYAGSLYNLYTQKQNSTNPYEAYNPFNKVDPFSGDKDYIRAVQKLHSTLSVIRPTAPTGDSFYKDSRVRSMSIVYRLKSGHTLTREYQVPIVGFEPELRAIMETEGYKKTEYVLSQLEHDVKTMNISTREGVVVLTHSAEINEFKALLRQEILGMSYADQIGDDVPLASVDIPITMEDRNVVSFYSYSILPSYHKLLNWLANKGYSDKIMITAKNIDSVEIAAFEPKIVSGDRSYYYDPEQYLAIARKENRSVVTQDKDEIADVLKCQKTYMIRKGTYLVKKNYEDGSPEYVLMEADDLSPELRKLLR
ncbi:DUF6449 domain-containing protein [Paenibacillus sp. GCM10012306]|uniref:DUF6449 domain-containing protein n=1 Tax=Paenibacillus sp. GCM10012306 TaxID=3317342 RepID=UPI0036176059